MVSLNWQKGAESFIDAVSSGNATPGGGAVGAFAAANGCGLVMMAMSITMKMKSTPAEVYKELNEALDEFIVLRDELKQCYLDDAKAYEDYLSAKKLPSASKEREEYLKTALAACVNVPLQTGLKAVKTLHMAETVESKISPVIISDIICAKIMLKASIQCCIENIKANLAYIKEEEFCLKLKNDIKLLEGYCR